MGSGKVFVTQFTPKGDYTEAEKWGNVCFITKHEHRPEPTSREINMAVELDIKKFRSLYIQGIDFILVSPSGVVNIAVGANLPCGMHKILKWDNRSKTYRLHKLWI